ncbi:MAG: peptide chain release factor 1 [Sandaracinaceae bacterium]|nr:peptide chain release factor 1 [Sandaracinaceae bacterium]
MIPRQKLDAIVARFRELEELLCRPEIAADGKRFAQLSRERSDLNELVEAYNEFLKTEEQIREDKEALADPELRELAEEELPQLEARLEELKEAIDLLLLPKDPNDEKNVFLEIRAGAGGEEAALFAADLFRMYSRYAERQGWKIEITSKSDASAGGFKEVIAIVTGDKVYSRLRFEAGVHRVQRVPVTESGGRIHTSTATVAVLPEADEVDVQIDDKDLEITKTAAGGPGGQGVNTTMSAINLKHIPTGIMVRAEEERSQHQNLARAMQILRAKLLEIAERERSDAIRDERRSMVGSGDRSEKIRTYNYPQNRVTDHRVQLTLHSLDSVMEGDLDELLTVLRTHYQAELLRATADERA